MQHAWTSLRLVSARSRPLAQCLQTALLFLDAPTPLSSKDPPTNTRAAPAIDKRRTEKSRINDKCPLSPNEQVGSHRKDAIELIHVRLFEFCFHYADVLVNSHRLYLSFSRSRVA